MRAIILSMSAIAPMGNGFINFEASAGDLRDVEAMPAPEQAAHLDAVQAGVDRVYPCLP